MLLKIPCDADLKTSRGNFKNLVMENRQDGDELMVGIKVL
jgi:hypothetical protein